MRGQTGDRTAEDVERDDSFDEKSRYAAIVSIQSLITLFKNALTY